MKAFWTTALILSALVNLPEPIYLLLVNTTGFFFLAFGAGWGSLLFWEHVESNAPIWVAKIKYRMGL